MTWVIFVTLAALVYQVESQICGCGTQGPVFQGPPPHLNSGLPQLPSGYPCNQPLINPVCPQPYSPQEPIILSQPSIKQTVCQQQPIITSAQPVCQPQPIITAAPVVATTIIDNTVSNALANAIQLLIVSNLIENTMNCGHVSPNVGSIIECITSNDDYSCDVEIPTICQCDGINFPTTEICQSFAPTVTNFATPCQTYGPIPQCLTDLINPTTQGPVAAEVYFPSAIPAQLTCNFGYMPTSVPCVSVNVEPLSMFDSIGSNVLSNGYYLGA